MDQHPRAMETLGGALLRKQQEQLDQLIVQSLETVVPWKKFPQGHSTSMFIQTVYKVTHVMNIFLWDIGIGSIIIHLFLYRVYALGKGKIGITVPVRTGLFLPINQWWTYNKIAMKVGVLLYDHSLSLLSQVICFIVWHSQILQWANTEVSNTPGMCLYVPARVRTTVVITQKLQGARTVVAKVQQCCCCLLMVR